MPRWRHGLVLCALLGWGLFLTVRCHLPRHPDSRRDSSADSTSAIYVVRHGWHAGIAVRRADLPDDGWPVLEAFPDATYLEVGWGEARYYPGRTRGVWGALRAGAWPTGSVLHVVPITGAVPASFPHNTIIRVPISDTERAALTEYIAASFDPDADTLDAAPGLYSDSRFYRSGLPYHVFNNCNHWAAGALEAAGCDTAPRWTFTVSRVLRRAQQCGTLLQRSSSNN
ncbi:MAG: DUF2459 domain-containing protein [Bacteroidetes bacterium SW_9_63_38]|nr:MAG: DUF2459 domain-containing protein [Bacteroidetes bacterium SW_9_63_38]